ncbi:DUF3560 domain-containing protein [Aliarcobacter butzleri]|uniref:DUF3560 domain-containing protein n=1 Tax=Aliarcobacter butzleri TaxID=28197 RepID=UPI0012698906|nr:DUF3560 domain-containing protein [Aliarcobacter butzleri]
MLENRFKKYYQNVFVAECDSKHNKGDIIELTTKYDKKVECEVHNLVGTGTNGKFYYSIVRVEDKSYAERKAEKYANSAEKHNVKSNKWYEKSQEGREFLSLAEPIKIGHHSERRHRALIDRNWNRMGNSVKEQKIALTMEQKAQYWENKAKEINLSMPDSLEYYQFRLEEATAYHKGLKDGSIPREHSFSLQYANKNVKDLTKKVEIAQKLWGEVETPVESN